MDKIMRTTVVGVDITERTSLRTVDVIAVLLLGILVTFALFFALNVPLTRLDVPYTFAGDAVDKLTQVKTVAETGWLFYNDRLGFPFGYDRLDFPRFDSLNYAIMGPIAALTGEAGLAMNLYYIAGYYLIAGIAYFCFRRLGLGAGVAIICAAIYAFIPYHPARGTWHVTNGAYFLIPLALLVSIRLGQGLIGTDTREMRRRWLGALVIAALVPLQTPYNGVFFAFTLIVAGAVSLANGWQWRKIAVVASLLAVIGGTFMIEQAPRLLHLANNGNPGTVARSAVEPELYSMRLSQVLLPTEEHRVPIMARIATSYSQGVGVPRNEVRNQYLGILGAVGFLGLFWAIARKPQQASGFPQPDLNDAVRVAGILAVTIILFAISSGVGTIVSHFLVKNIRAYNRILPFLAFLALFGGGWVLSMALANVKSLGLRLLCGILIGAILMFDIIPKSSLATGRAGEIAQYDAMKSYFASVEEHLGRGAAVFELPARWYPEFGPLNRSPSYDELKPYLLTDTLRFSAGVGRFREGYQWWRVTANRRADQLVDAVMEKKFDAILVDGFAYAPDDLSKVVAELSRVVPAPPLVSADQRYWTFSLDGCCNEASFDDLLLADAISYPIDGRSVAFTTADAHKLPGWHPSENWGTWANGDAEINFKLEPASERSLELAVETMMMVGPNVPERKLTIECNGHPCGEFSYTPQTAVQTVKTRVPTAAIRENGLLNLRFITTPESTPIIAGVGPDGRTLGIGLKRITILPVR